MHSMMRNAHGYVGVTIVALPVVAGTSLLLFGSNVAVDNYIRKCKDCFVLHINKQTFFKFTDRLTWLAEPRLALAYIYTARACVRLEAGFWVVRVQASHPPSDLLVPRATMGLRVG